MAKRSFSPVLWFLLALLLRAELEAVGQTRYPTSTLARSSNKTATFNPPLRWRSPNQAAAYTAAITKASIQASGPAVDYAISGETYQNELGSDAAPLRKTLRRGSSNTNLIPARVYGDREFEADLPPEFADEQVGYEEEELAATDGMESVDPESEYLDEMYGNEHWGDEAGHEGDYSTPTSRFFHWLGTFRADHGYWFRTSKNSPRHIGIGQPLHGTSWLNRPSSIGFFAGVLNGDTLIANRVQQGSALFGGLRLGWDFDHYWGVEARGGWASPDVQYPNVPPDRVDGIFLCDASILYYPWGDAACRPYALLGMGMAMFDFTDEFGDVHNEFLLGIPLGIGFKYQYHPNLAFRAEFLDNTAWGSSGLDNMNNLSFTLGMEMRFGGKPRSYYPWQPAKYIW